MNASLERAIADLAAACPSPQQRSNVRTLDPLIRAHLRLLGSASVQLHALKDCVQTSLTKAADDGGVSVLALVRVTVCLAGENTANGLDIGTRILLDLSLIHI